MHGFRIHFNGAIVIRFFCSELIVKYVGRFSDKKLAEMYRFVRGEHNANYNFIGTSQLEKCYCDRFYCLVNSR